MEHNSWSGFRYLAISVTVAILAQGTSWAVAVTQAFLFAVRILPPAIISDLNKWQSLADITLFSQPRKRAELSSAQEGACGHSVCLLNIRFADGHTALNAPDLV